MSNDGEVTEPPSGSTLARRSSMNANLLIPALTLSLIPSQSTTPDVALLGGEVNVSGKRIS